MELKRDERQKEKEFIRAKFQVLEKEDKIELISYFLDELKKYGIREPVKKDVSIPVGVFDNNVLSSLEAIVKYLREELHLKFSKIAELLNRSGKTIWTTYKNAAKKMPATFSEITEDIMIPASRFANRSLSTLENVVAFIKDLNYSNHEVALMLHLDDRTIWTVYDRVKKKRGMKLGRK